MNNKIVLVVIVLIVVFAGVMFLSNKKSSETVTQTTEQVSPVTQPESTTQSETQTQESGITITSSGFTPAAISIKSGTKVVWTNKSGALSAVNSALHPTHLIYPPLNLGGVSDNGSVSLIFNKPGTYKYHDHLNPARTGIVVVE